MHRPTLCFPPPFFLALSPRITPFRFSSAPSLPMPPAPLFGHAPTPFMAMPPLDMSPSLAMLPLTVPPWPCAPRLLPFSCVTPFRAAFRGFRESRLTGKERNKVPAEENIAGTHKSGRKRIFFVCSHRTTSRVYSKFPDLMSSTKEASAQWACPTAWKVNT